jgi:cobalt-zinc-cadmium efflux system membrane fusion protein
MTKANHARRCRRHIAFLVCSLLSLSVLLLAAGCSGDKPEPSSTKVVETNADPNVFTMQNPNQFALTSVQVRKVSDEVHVNCAITPDVNLSVPVVSLGGGMVVEIKSKLGDYVKKGQVLLLINSPDLSGAFSDYQKANADEQLADKQLARSQLLYDKGAIALADLENAQDVHAKASVDLETSIAHVKVLGGDIRNPTTLLPLRAPISGTIVDQQITNGTGVRSLDNQQALFTIADLSQVWVICDVYQDMLPQVHVGDIANISVNGYAHDQFAGKVINISQVLDPTTRTAKVRIELPNPNGIMRAGMYVTAMFHARAQVERPAVPTTAIIQLHDSNWVFVPLGNGQFRRVRVELGPEEEGGYQQVISGLKPNDQVVTNALQFSNATEEK